VLGLTSCGDDFVTPVDGAGAGGAATGGAGSVASGGAGGESFEEFSAACQARAARFCDAFFACWPIDAMWFYSDEATCLAVKKGECEELYGKGTGLTTEAMLTCEAALPAEPSCDGSIANACSITGAEPDGTACFSHYECQSGRCWPSSASAGCGVCSPSPGPGNGDGGPGEPCPCEQGLGCDPPSQTCFVLSDQGGPCEQPIDCTFDLTCYAGTCGAQGDVGDPCEPTSFGTPDTCRYGQLRCNPYSLVCEALAAPSPVGGECGYDGSGHFRLCEGGACALGSNPSGPSSPGVCVSYRQEGDPCGSTLFDSYYGHTGFDCAPGMLCVNEDGEFAIIGTGTCQSTPWRDCSE